MRGNRCEQPEARRESRAAAVKAVIGFLLTLAALLLASFVVTMARAGVS